MRRPENVVAFRPRSGREPWVTAKRVAEHFEVSTRTVQRWKERGAPFLPAGGSVRYRISDLESWLQGTAP
jgi:phage terminase Nu1 subunit (DNA packaging protein)